MCGTIKADSLHAFLRSRRSIRHFRPDTVPDAAIQRILASATCAPSAHNRQPGRFVVLTTAASRARLADAMTTDFRQDLERDGVHAEEIAQRVEKSRSRLVTAPVAIVLCLDGSALDLYPDKRRQKAEYVMFVQSVAVAGLQLLLAAQAEGLGSVWICSPLFAPEAVRHSLELPDAWEPQAMFFLGYSARSPQPRTLRPLASVAVWK